MTGAREEGTEIEFLTPTSHGSLQGRRPGSTTQNQTEGEGSESQAERVIQSGSTQRRVGLAAFTIVLVALGLTARLGTATDSSLAEDREDSIPADPDDSADFPASTVPLGVPEEPLVPARFIPLLAPLANDLGITKPVTGYWAVVGTDPGEAVLLDLESMESRPFPDQIEAANLATDEFLVTVGEGGGSYLVPLAGLPSIREPGAMVFGAAIQLEDAGSHAFASGEPDTFWFVPENSEGTLLQLRNATDGTVVEEFETATISWSFRSGNPIGNSSLGGVYELDPGSPNSVRRVADAELVAADSGRALMRSCDELCHYQWLNRSNWSPVDLPVPEPEPVDLVTSSAGDWRIEGSGRWLVRDDGRLVLIDLVGGRTLDLDVGQDPDRDTLISNDGRWLSYLDQTATRELVLVRLATGDRFQTPVPNHYRLFGLVREPQLLGEGDPFRADLLATHEPRMNLPGFRTGENRPTEAGGLTIVVAGWLGTAASLELATDESHQIGGLTEISYVDATGIVGLSPANDLTVVGLDGLKRRTRQLEYFDDLVVLPGPSVGEAWLGSSSPGGPGFATELSLIDLATMEVQESFGYRLLDWKSGGATPLASSLDGIYRFGGQTVDLAHAGSAVVVGDNLVLTWECEEDRIENGDEAGDGCGFAWREPGHWDQVDRLVPQHRVGIGGLFGSDRWLLTFSSPEASILLDTLSGQTISFGADWLSLFDISDDGRWAIHKEGQAVLVLTDLASAASDATAPIDYRDLVSYRMELNQKVSSVKFLPSPEIQAPQE